METKTPAERERIFWKNLGRFPATYGADNPGTFVAPCSAHALSEASPCRVGSLFEKSGCSWNFSKIRSVRMMSRE